jgi:hypothetical protein
MKLYHTVFFIRVLTQIILRPRLARTWPRIHRLLGTP